MQNLSLARLYALRASFVLFPVGIGLEFWPSRIREGTDTFFACLVILPVIPAIPWRRLFVAYAVMPARWT